jgi:peroxiredoxin
MTPGLASRLCLRCLLPMLLAFDAAAVEAGAAPVKAPPFELPDLERNEHRLSDYAGKVLVVNFWASWCVPCRQELPSMNRAARKLIEQPVAWIAINVGEDSEAVKAFTADYPIDFTVLLDPSGRISQSWQVVGMPTTVVVNREGYVTHRIVGKHEWDDEVHVQMLIEIIDN